MTYSGAWRTERACPHVRMRLWSRSSTARRPKRRDALSDRAGKGTCSTPAAHPLARRCMAMLERAEQVSLVERAGAALVPHPSLSEAMREEHGARLSPSARTRGGDEPMSGRVRRCRGLLCSRSRASRGRPRFASLTLRALSARCRASSASAAGPERHLARSRAREAPGSATSTPQLCFHSRSASVPPCMERGRIR